MVYNYSIMEGEIRPISAIMRRVSFEGEGSRFVVHFCECANACMAADNQRAALDPFTWERSGGRVEWSELGRTIRWTGKKSGLRERLCSPNGPNKRGKGMKRERQRGKWALLITLGEWRGNREPPSTARETPRNFLQCKYHSGIRITRTVTKLTPLKWKYEMNIFMCVF